MLAVSDESMFTDFENAEQDDQMPRKVIDANRTIYCSRKFRFPKDALWGEPVLCDFGQARIGRTHRGIIQPEVYKAPEVLFEMDWSYSVDIWNVGVMVSTLLIFQYYSAERLLWVFAAVFPKSAHCCSYGIFSKISICSTPSMKISSIPHRTMLRRWWRILGYRHHSMCSEAK